MATEVMVTLGHECQVCGDGLSVELIEISGIVRVYPCGNCIAKSIATQMEDAKIKFEKQLAKAAKKIGDQIKVLDTEVFEDD